MFEKYYATARVEVDSALERFNAKGMLDIRSVSPNLEPIADPFFTLCQNKMSKRLRAILTILAYEICGGTNRSEIVSVSIAFELFQTGVLAHDDIIDRSITRRGQNALHVSLENLMNNDHYGLSQAICVGDLGMFWGFEAILKGKFDAPFLLAGSRVFAKMTRKTIIGEMLDVHVPYTEKTVSEAEYLAIIKNKTSWYSFIGPMQVGASLAGAKQEVIDFFELLGIELGYAFQIRDDYLGIFGEASDTGKSNTSDISENKQTLLTILIDERANPSQKEKLNSIFGKSDITEDELAEIRNILLTLKISNSVKAKVHQHLKQASDFIEGSFMEIQHKKILLEMCQKLGNF